MKIVARCEIVERNFDSRGYGERTLVSALPSEWYK